MNRLLLLLVWALAVAGCTPEPGTVAGTDAAIAAVETKAEGEQLGSSQPLVSTPSSTVGFGSGAQLEHQPEPCKHQAGTGDLATDIVATWFFLFNASPWTITVAADGTAQGIAGSDIVGTTPREFEADWNLQASELTIVGMHSHGPASVTFFDETDAGWRVGNAASPDFWRRCG